MDDRVAAGRVIDVPFDNAIKEHLQQPQPLPNGVDRQRLTGLGVHISSELELESFDMCPVDVDNTNHRRVVLTDPEPENA
ncbi:MAG: hypothetical protein QNJ75_05135 [Acidimicrobiia bacterium]|nr:hypothetical protein [Acidimicrobiia bacterium]